MPGSRNLRVIVFCLGFETVKVLKPIEFYRADRAYMLCMTKSRGYKDFKKEIERRMKKSVEYHAVETVVYEFAACFKELLAILRKEKEEGNHVYVNLTGTPAFSAAAMIVCMMTGAIPFFAGTKKYTNEDPGIYYVKGRPVGIAREVYDPLELPIFCLEPPDQHVVNALRVWKSRKDNAWIMTDTKIIEDLVKKDLMKDVHDNRKRVTQKAKMQYRRRYLEKWLENGWMRSVGRGKYELTESGEVVVEVF